MSNPLREEYGLRKPYRFRIKPIEVFHHSPVAIRRRLGSDFSGGGWLPTGLSDSKLGRLSPVFRRRHLCHQTNEERGSYE